VSLSDTVGFIRDLPHKLVEAFEATLQEAADADLLLHVMDAASPQCAEQRAEVERVLEEIGAGEVPQVWVCNKCDLLEPSAPPARWPTGSRCTRRAACAACLRQCRTAEGLDALAPRDRRGCGLGA
jgi:GTP-binding protein HflX